LAKLTTKKRNRLNASAFGQPKKRAYPMPDRSHAANAKARAKQQLNKGKLSQSGYNTIIAKANKLLGKGKAHAAKKRK